MKLDFHHGAIVLAAAAAFLLGVEWLYLALGVLFVALVAAEYATTPSGRPVPPPMPPGQQMVPPIIIQAGSQTDFLDTFLSNLITDYTQEFKYRPFSDLGKYPKYADTHAYKESERLRKEIEEDVKKQLAASGK